MWTLPLLILSLLLCALPVRAQVWPNEPSGSTVISDYGFDNIFQPSDASGSFAGWTSFCESCTSVDSVAAGAGPAPFSARLSDNGAIARILPAGSRRAISSGRSPV